jgi:hypothetical protein
MKPGRGESFRIVGVFEQRRVIPRGLHVKTPYDSLSLVPNILTLMGTPDPMLPGPVIKEVLGQ